MAVYYDVWKPPRGDEASRLVYIRKELIPKIRFDDLKLSLEMRCYHDASLGKLSMMEILYKVSTTILLGTTDSVGCRSDHSALLHAGAFVL